MKVTFSTLLNELEIGTVVAFAVHALLGGGIAAQHFSQALKIGSLYEFQLPEPSFHGVYTYRCLDL